MPDPVFSHQYNDQKPFSLKSTLADIAKLTQAEGVLYLVYRKRTIPQLLNQLGTIKRIFQGQDVSGAYSKGVLLQMQKWNDQMLDDEGLDTVMRH